MSLNCKNVVVTGGAGFAGSHIVDLVCQRFPDAEVRVADKMTYAGDIRNILPLISANRVNLMVGDVSDTDFCHRVVKGADLVIHAAAESHVDNSFHSSLNFTKSNALGTHAMVEACRDLEVPAFVHISTDEVYGEVIDGSAPEDAPLLPTNPYSASKAAAEMIVRGYAQSFKLPVKIIRANNLYGPRQYPEKIIPRFICHMMLGRPLTLHGDGSNRRHYLAVEDFAEAVLHVAEHGTVGETYNIGTDEEYRNIHIAETIAGFFQKDLASVVEYVPDRPFNDARYSVDASKLERLGWKPRRRLADNLPDVVAWYKENFFRYEPLFGTIGDF
ncbi:UDP-glucose 4,6-dehydratase [Rhodobium orientis]|uniref:dTDP-glucose 4,6-dehydratase n=1 Tax=Rhodobium orientis TaxID=34017 RepID=A0A327K072_9HYPH|nr:GDP-mannose 4,6-dehydratase [Rhodobium orientis]MBB4304248.1 UDP-glucose 4,6-dehydratase [Rhodobium orientis]MBK5948256.1 dTDP-glucose 4,6-dehydratase [Rhodobium orientis]RAI28758.1 dTDP-glucose 4,6-dehydratase [Rhodobium orientis]